MAGTQTKKERRRRSQLLRRTEKGYHANEKRISLTKRTPAEMERPRVWISEIEDRNGVALKIGRVNDGRLPKVRQLKGRSAVRGSKVVRSRSRHVHKRQIDSRLHLYAPGLVDYFSPAIILEFSSKYRNRF